MSKSRPLPPFDNPAADIILRSSDGVNFHVHSIILAEASPVFADMLSIPQPANTMSRIKSKGVSEGKPIVNLSEESQTLDRLLRLCYPVRDPVLDTLSDVYPVLSAAMKYEMDAATALMREDLVTFIEHNLITSGP